MQTRALVQVFLNLAVFGMDIQEAIDAPRIQSYNWPNSFAPHEYRPGTVGLEESVYESAGSVLEKYGYTVEKEEKWADGFSAVCAVIRDPKTGKLIGGADPREDSWAMGK